MGDAAAGHLYPEQQQTFHLKILHVVLIIWMHMFANVHLWMILFRAYWPLLSVDTGNRRQVV